MQTLRAVAGGNWPGIVRPGLSATEHTHTPPPTPPPHPRRRYIWAGHPHGLLGNAYFLAFCTDLLGFSKLFPGIRLSIGGSGVGVVAWGRWAPLHPSHAWPLPCKLTGELRCLGLRPTIVNFPAHWLC